MRSHLALLLLLAACTRPQSAGSADTAHLGEPTVARRSASVPEAPDIRFLEHMIQHQKTLADLLSLAGAHKLSPRGRDVIARAEKHRFDDESALVAARQGYGGGRLSSTPPAVEASDRIEQFRGPEYERRLINRLIDHYKEEVAEIDASLSQLEAENVRALAERIRRDRRNQIRDLAGKSRSE